MPPPTQPTHRPGTGGEQIQRAAVFDDGFGVEALSLTRAHAVEHPWIGEGAECERYALPD